MENAYQYENNSFNPFGSLMKGLSFVKDKYWFIICNAIQKRTRISNIKKRK